MRLKRIRKQKHTKRQELHEPDSEFTPTRSRVEEEQIYKTLTDIDNALSVLNKHTW